MGLYNAGLSLFALLARISPLASGLTSFSRIWLRHARWRLHLRHFAFDGVIDGGANIGEFAAVVRESLPQAHLVCVEPHPECAAILRRKGFEVVEAALWNEPGTLNLAQPGSPTSSTVAATQPGRPNFAVKSIRLDEIPVGGSRLLVKLDLQGAEETALQALGPLLERTVTFLVEVSVGPGGNFERLHAFFAERGYALRGSVNELFEGGRQIEADLLWVKSDLP